MKLRITLEFEGDEEAETPEECLAAFMKGEFDVQDLQACGDLTARIERVD